MKPKRARRRSYLRDAILHRRAAASPAVGRAATSPPRSSPPQRPSGRVRARRKPTWTPEDERLLIRVLAFAGVLSLSFLLAGCNGSNQPNNQTNQFPQTPVGGPAQPCPNSDVVQVEILDDQINLPVKNRTVIVHYSDGTTLPVVTDQNGIASVCVRPGQTFTIEVPDIHTLSSETHVPR